jgi:Rieske Fe-S protein
VKFLLFEFLLACTSKSQNSQQEDTSTTNIDSPPKDTDTVTAPETEDSAEEPDCLESTLQIDLLEYPELLVVGKSQTVSFPEQFVHVLIICVAEHEWLAVWQICTHGNCEVEWDSDTALVRCPCHNSLFDWDGSVLQGPATRSLSTYDVCRLDSTLLLTPILET